MSRKHETVSNIEALLQSDITAYKIQQMTGINRSTIGRLKNGEIKIINLSLENTLKLNELWEELEDKLSPNG